MEHQTYFHSVTLNKDLCHGCITCVKRCPTEAIRVRDGKARILGERCIDCGECDMCDLDPTKVCDNCGKCIHSDAEYNTVVIDQIINPEDEQFIADDADLGDDE